jgi:aspartyl-tRNA(Asn)/glutamyl-tRNA(Gln) amidotransferase subunit A
MNAGATAGADGFAFAPIHDLGGRQRRGEISAAALTDLCLDRIARHDGKLHAFVDLYADAARQAAAAADGARQAGAALGPLHGIPVALKDLVEIAGHVTTAGALIWRERVSSTTATIVGRLRAAGMIIVGKTHLVEFAFGGWGINRAMGTPWNPWDLEVHRVPGGSSSGSAVAVAAGLVPAAIGSDTGGSIRIPASQCGIVGLKVTPGRISNHGVVKLSERLDTLGPLARSVEDAALLFDALHGPDPADPRTLSHPPVDPLAGLRGGVAGLRLAVLPDAELGELDDEVRAAFAAALAVLRSLGARIETLALPVPFAELAARTGDIIAAEAYARHRDDIERDDLVFDPDVQRRMRGAKAIAAADYIRLVEERPRVAREAAGRLGDFAALLLPTTPIPAIPLADVDYRSAPLSRLTRPINYLDLCGLALPCGFSRAGLPLSLQIVGRPGDEAGILRIGWAYENATAWRQRHPALG